MNRVMREIGPTSDLPPAFPLAGGALAPLRATAEAQGSSDFSPIFPNVLSIVVVSAVVLRETSRASAYHQRH